MEFILIKSLHIISILVLFACLAVELSLVAPSLTRQKIKLLSLVDALYGISSVFVLLSGFYIALSLGKGRDFYFDNTAIYIKLFLFICVGLLSIYPTFFFLKNRNGTLDEVLSIPDTIKKVILIEIVLLLCIPPFAVILANGINL